MHGLHAFKKTMHRCPTRGLSLLCPSTSRSSPAFLFLFAHQTVFDVNWFISYLAKDVTTIKRVSDKLRRTMENKKPQYTMHVPRKSLPEYYLDQVLPIHKRRRGLQLTKFDYRLANNVDEELQKLRCWVILMLYDLQNLFKNLDRNLSWERMKWQNVLL